MKSKSIEIFSHEDPLGQWKNAPKNWQKYTLLEIGEYFNGMIFSPKQLGSIGLPVIKIAELKKGVSETTKYYDGDYDSKYLLKVDDILFSWSASIDIFWWRYGDALLNQHIFRVFPKPNIDKNFLFYLLKFLLPTFNRIREDQETTMGHVKISDLKRLIAKIPPLDVQKRLCSILRCIDDQIFLLSRKNDYLEKMIV